MKKIFSSLIAWLTGVIKRNEIEEAGQFLRLTLYLRIQVSIKRGTLDQTLLESWVRNVLKNQPPNRKPFSKPILLRAAQKRLEESLEQEDKQIWGLIFNSLHHLDC